MLYKSTRDSGVSVTASQAVCKGISDEGGLFVPESIPWLSYEDIQKLTEMDYAHRAANILGRFLGDFTPEEIDGCVSKAYTRQKFETDTIAPLYALNGSTYVMELWHGPTCAFKDMALQLLPYLMDVSRKKSGDGKTVVILVATSGDTGKAALEGFKNVPGTKILVFYPQQGVSDIQKRQMQTQEGGNVGVCAIDGNFDDAQKGVKAIFTDGSVRERLDSRNMVFSSANSINWGRLVPQIVYYVSAYCSLIKNEKLSYGEPVNFVVPTGNFGNILAAYYAKKMGIPVNKLICASNFNNVLTDFLKTGYYNKNRRFYTTISPSMDILVSSNLERLLYDLSACDDQKIRGWMDSLAEKGSYGVDDYILKRLRENFWAGFCDDAATSFTIKSVYDNYSYLCDPHTAVAMNVYFQYLSSTSDITKTVIVSTASPFKFAPDVMQAVTGVHQEGDAYEIMKNLAKTAMDTVPRQLMLLKDKPARFSDVCGKSDMKDYVLQFIGG